MGLPQFIETARENAAYKILSNDRMSGTLSHAYIFAGRDRLLLSLLAVQLCADILGKNDENQANLIFSNTHSDVIRLPFDEPDGKKRVKIAVADIEKLISTLHYRPVYGDKKIYILDLAETMNTASQNKLLKSLEEPPPSVHFILICSSKAALLPTVLSRCKIIEPPPLEVNAIKSALEHVYGQSETVETAAALCGGSLETASSMMTDKRFSAVFATALTSLLNLTGSKNILFCSAQLINYKDKLPAILEYYEILFRDIMVLGAGLNRAVSLKAKLDDIQKLAEGYTPDACADIIEKITKAKIRLNNNGNSTSIIDELLFSIAEIKAMYKK